MQPRIHGISLYLSGQKYVKQQTACSVFRTLGLTIRGGLLVACKERFRAWSSFNKKSRNDNTTSYTNYYVLKISSEVALSFKFEAPAYPYRNMFHTGEVVLVRPPTRGEWDFPTIKHPG